jgi:hypothetical protein
MLRIRLDLEGKIYELENMTYSSYLPTQGYDTTATLSFSIKSNRIDQVLLDWCMSTVIQPKDGKITVLNADDDTLMKTITFKKGYSTGLSESIYGNDSYNSYPLNINLTAEKITVKLEKQKPNASRDERFG